MKADSLSNPISGGYKPNFSTAISPTPVSFYSVGIYTYPLFKLSIYILTNIQARPIQHIKSNRTQTLITYRPRSLGSNTSLNASPNRLNPSTTMNIATPGISLRAGCLYMLFSCRFNIPPQLGTSGGTPTPRKLNDASIVIANPR
ncbi:MAG: hypothetical protein CM1200mP35_01620 [Chloroflexota bacterium]|nr:MAG: hypothetical protein CM1200mP35_01620 [Chloroflexota bacterium]